jgi:hypothetical protein
VVDVWSDSVSEWVTATYGALDGRDVDGFVTRLTPGATIRVGNGAPVAGRIAIREALLEFLDAVAGVSHGVVNEWRDGETLIIESEMTVTRADETTIVLPSATVFRMSGELAEQVQIYVDLTPAFTGREMPSLCRPAVASVA